MKFASFVGGLAALSTSVFGFAIPSVEDGLSTLEKRAVLPVTGVPGSTHPRLEISQLKAQQANQWTLYLLAMQKFQAQAQTLKTSYYQIAGIHGVPRATWDGVGECSACAGADGYCTHDSILFLGWHRAYLALFEQQLVAVAKTIANSYPASKKAVMQTAATNLRLPYWDWAAHPPSGQSTLPTMITAQTVTVNGPSGSQTIKNPLYRHLFTSPSALHYSPFTKYPGTLRYPTSNDASATSQETKAIQAFNNIRASMQDQVYQMFSTCDEFVEVGSDAQGQSSSKCSNSLENIHNTIHTTAGGPKANGISGGHMTYLATAAFDPVFWLHHTNVDRMFAMWQALYPSSYGGSQVAPHNTWTIAKGTTQNADSPLTPFHKDASGNFWTTNGVRDTKTFHYTYPEFADSDGSKSAIASYVNKLYGPKATATAGSSKRDAAAEAAPVVSSSADGTTAAATHTSTTAAPAQTTVTTPLIANNGSLFQYVANIQTPRYALNGSYSIFLFNDDPASESPSEWILDSNLIGPMGVLAQPGMVNTELIAVGSVPLTRTLSDEVANGALTSLAEALAVPYLKAHLKWRIQGPNGLSVDPNTIDDFEIAVYASTAAPASEYELPVWSALIPLAEITENKAGGATVGSITNGTTVARL